MRERAPLLIGVFVVMALSNAIVPILASFGDSTTAQGAIYASYFFGAFLLVLPAGILSDRIGEFPLILAGLVLTFLSGLLLMTTTAPALLIVFRLIEGVGAGLFIPSALSILNARPDHGVSSGYFMGMLNLGLVIGLFTGGWLAEWTGMPFSGIVLFTLLALIPVGLSFLLPRKARSRPSTEPGGETLYRLKRAVTDYAWLWISSVILIGLTGALTVLYPEFSDLPPGIVGVTIGAMSIATAAAVIVLPHVNLQPIMSIRIAAIGMAVAAMLTLITPLSFILVGAFAGVVMISQLSFLAEVEARQGVVMGLFSTASYGGMALLPFIAGAVADMTSFPVAFLVMALLAIVVAAGIGRCRCRNVPPGPGR